MQSPLRRWHVVSGSGAADVEASSFRRDDANVAIIHTHSEFAALLGGVHAFARIDFADSQGHRLSGQLELPDGARQAWTIFARYFTCGPQDTAPAYVPFRTTGSHGSAAIRRE